MRLGVLLLIAAHLPLLCAEQSHAKEPPSISGRGKVKPTPCVKGCGMKPKFRKTSTRGIEHSTPKRILPGTEGRARKKSTPRTERKTAKRSTPGTEHSTSKKFMPGTKHSTPKKSMPWTNGRTTKKITLVTEDKTTKKSTLGTEDSTPTESTTLAKCELFYFVPTAKHTNEAFFFWNNTRVEQLVAYLKISTFLQHNPHEKEPIFFPAHLPLVEKRNGSEVLVLKDVYVRAKGACGSAPVRGRGYYDTNPDWFQDEDQRLQEKLKIIENYVQRIPRSHFGYKVPKDGDNDVCLDETGLIVKDFPGIRTCFSMWIFDDRDQKPKHFAGRQIYNRINQTLHVNVTKIGFDPSGGSTHLTPIETESFSLPTLFLKQMCQVINESLEENSCTYWTTNRFYVSLCCCYTNRRECAYRKYKFPVEEKLGEPEIRACAMGDYYLMKDFGGASDPQSAGVSVREFVQGKTSSEFCKWTYTWNISKETAVEDVLQVHLAAAMPATEDVLQGMRDCARENKDGSCCERMKNRCPVEPDQETEPIVVRCFCNDADLCNKKHSYLHKELVRKFKETRPCEAHTADEHLLSLTPGHKKPNTNSTHGYMCPIFYNFAHPLRPNTFLQLVGANNFMFVEPADMMLFLEDGCHLVEVEIKEAVGCTDRLFGEHNETLYEKLLILLCSIEGNPLGENRTSYPDAELKKTIEANLTDAKAEFPTCKNGSWSLDFESVSELVIDSSKLERMFDNLTDEANDNVTTAHCFVEVSFVYQQQYNFTFGAVSIDDKPLHHICHDRDRSVNDYGVDAKQCVLLNSAAHDELKHYACCCRRHWNKTLGTCGEALRGQLKTLLWNNTIAETSEKIMGELRKDPLTKCDDAHINRPCARNEGCYTGVHARDVPATTRHKTYGGCVSKYAPGAKKRDNKASDEVNARFYRICRLSRNQGECFAVLGTEDIALPDDVTGPQIVCCCGGQRETAQKCSRSHKFGKKIGDFDTD